MTEESSWTQPEGFSGPVAKLDETPVPVSSVRVKGTEWSEVKCEDGRTYYVHVSTEDAVWTTPPEVEAAKAAAAAAAEAAAAEERQRHATKLAAMRQQQAAQQAIQRGLLAVGAPGAGGPGGRLGPTLGQGRGRGGYFYPSMFAPGAVAAANAAAAAARAKADALQRFKELLMDKGVTPFSRWEREVPKLESDPRWAQLASNKERRAAFDDWCKNVAAEQLLKEERARRVRRNLHELLEEAVELELRLLATQRQESSLAAEGEEEEEGEERVPRPPLPGAGPEGGELGEADVAAQLTVEHLEKYWGNDERWKEAPAGLRAEVLGERFGAARARAEQAAAAAATAAATAFKALLQEQGVTASSLWEGVRGGLEADPRCQAVKAKAERERLFREFVEEEGRRERRAEEEGRLRAEAERRVEAAEKEARERQLKAAHADSLAAFRALLAEVVREPLEAHNSSWRLVSPRLAKDPQRRLQGLGSEREAEDAFRSHLLEVGERSRTAFRALLAEKLAPLAAHTGPGQGRGGGEVLAPALTSFMAAQELLGEEPRWGRLTSELREREWQAAVDSLLHGPAPGAAPADVPAAAPSGRADPAAPGSSAAAPAPRAVPVTGGSQVPRPAHDPAYAREYGLAAAGQAPRSQEPSGPRPAPELGASSAAAAAAAAAAVNNRLPPPPPIPDKASREEEEREERQRQRAREERQRERVREERQRERERELEREREERETGKRERKGAREGKGT
ncbi:hypothetical protein V8C86DRAFT_618363 [Haematococcus lacustris]